MKIIKLKIHNYSTISIYTTIDEVANEFAKNKYKIIKTIPITDIKIEDSINEFVDNINTMYIVQGKDNTINFNVDSNSILITIKDKKIRILDYIYMLLQMFSNDLSNTKKYLLHSSALKYDDDRSILLVGDANSGKSTLAYNLISNYGMQLISNDHTLIGKEDSVLKTFSGTKPLELRCGVIDKYFPDFQFLIKDTPKEELWSKKIIVNDHIDKNMISSNDKTIVSDIYQVDLCEGGNCFLKPKDYIDQRLFMYEHLSKQLKGTYNLITGYDYPMPSVETPEKLKILNNQIKDYLENVNVHMCKGSINELSKAVVKKLEKK